MNDSIKNEYKDCWTGESRQYKESDRLLYETRRFRESNLSIFDPDYELLIDWWEDSQLE